MSLVVGISLPDLWNNCSAGNSMSVLCSAKAFKSILLLGWSVNALSMVIVCGEKYVSLYISIFCDFFSGNTIGACE